LNVWRKSRGRTTAALALLAILPALAARAAAGPTAAKPATLAADGMPLELEVAGAHLRIALRGDSFAIGATPVIEWVRRSATIVGDYYGSFPVRSLEVTISAVPGGRVRNGRAVADGSPLIRISIGREVSAAELIDDWVLVHEMTHFALPEVGEEHAWLAEGLATYVEGIARVQAGNLAAGELWREEVEGMPRGLPQAADAGLDRTHTWARNYWGGALFCLAADVAIRERTRNRLGLQDALRAVNRASGGMTASWPVKRVFATGDAATGTTVLTDLYRQMRTSPAAPDLPDLWRRLGITSEGGRVQLATQTNPAVLREAITRRPAPP
jgi:hypothetical protein